MGILFVILVIALIISVIVDIYKNKEARSYYGISFFIFSLSLLISYLTMKYFYSSKIVVGYSETTEDAMHHQFYGYEPSYQFENLGYWIMLLLPPLLIYLYTKIDDNKRILWYKSLRLLPIYILISIYMLFFNIDNSKPFYHEQDMVKDGREVYPK